MRHWIWLDVVLKSWRWTKLRHRGVSRADHSPNYAAAASSKAQWDRPSSATIFRIIELYQNDQAKPELNRLGIHGRAVIYPQGDSKNTPVILHQAVCTKRCNCKLLFRKETLVRCCVCRSAVLMWLKTVPASHTALKFVIVMGVTSRWLILCKHCCLPSIVMIITSLHLLTPTACVYISTVNVKQASWWVWLLQWIT